MPNSLTHRKGIEIDFVIKLYNPRFDIIIGDIEFKAAKVKVLP